VLGNPLDLRPDEIGGMAEVAPEDLARAESLWKAANADTDLAGLLDAAPEGRDGG
jgi:hypothetical protein